MTVQEVFLKSMIEQCRDDLLIAQLNDFTAVVPPHTSWMEAAMELIREQDAVQQMKILVRPRSWR